MYCPQRELHLTRGPPKIPAVSSTAEDFDGKGALAKCTAPGEIPNLYGAKYSEVQYTMEPQIF